MVEDDGEIAKLDELHEVEGRFKRNKDEVDGAIWLTQGSIDF